MLADPAASRYLAPPRTGARAMQPPRHPDRFVDRHLGPDSPDIEAMLAVLGVGNLDELINRTVPASIRLQRPLDLPAGRSEFGLLRELAEIAAGNQVHPASVADCLDFRALLSRMQPGKER